METYVKINNSNFQFSIDDIDKSLSHENYLQFIFEKFQDINLQRFPNDKNKQQIRKYKDRIVGSCPYCGDSMKSSHKHRGNIILSGKFINYYKCFNCGIFKRIDYFLKDYKIDVNLDTINYISNNLTDFSTHSNTKYNMSLFMDMDIIDKYAIEKEYMCKSLNLSSIKNSYRWSWLTDRLQYNESKFLYDNKDDSVLILNLTPSGKILGMQKRTFRGENKYLSYKLNKIYKLLNIDDNIPNEIDSISSLFNICLVNYNKPIILLEGPLDSFLIANSIANTGANKQFPLDIPIKFLYDKDETGVKKSIEHINNGEEVFLWDKFLKEINAPYRKKWDVTDILIWAKKNNLKLPKFENYFSNDPLDIIDI